MDQQHDWLVRGEICKEASRELHSKYRKHKTTMFLCSACDMERMDFAATPTSASGSLEMPFHQVSDYSQIPFLFHDLSTP